MPFEARGSVIDQTPNSLLARSSMPTREIHLRVSKLLKREPIAYCGSTFDFRGAGCQPASGICSTSLYWSLLSLNMGLRMISEVIQIYIFLSTRLWFSDSRMGANFWMGYCPDFELARLLKHSLEILYDIAAPGHEADIAEYI
jgi:hypothetical protein